MQADLVERLAAALEQSGAIDLQTPAASKAKPLIGQAAIAEELVEATALPDSAEAPSAAVAALGRRGRAKKAIGQAKAEAAAVHPGTADLGMIATAEVKFFKIHLENGKPNPEHHAS